MPTTSARERLASLFDSFVRFDETQPVDDPIGFPRYSEQRREATTQSGESEAVITGIGIIDSASIIAAVFEFGFMGGTMSREVGRRLETAMEEAEQRGLPFVAVTATGGARMQEGMAALSQMPRTIAASQRLADAGIPRISILCHPTTGGVYASFASLSDVIAAEEGATIGFAGPRVAEAMTGRELPDHSHTAEAALRSGLVDYVLHPDSMRTWLGSLMQILRPTGSSNEDPAGSRKRNVSDPRSAWDLYTSIRGRDPSAPLDIIQAVSDSTFQLHGDRMGTDDGSVTIGFGKSSGTPFCFAAMGRGSPAAGGFRKARRAIELAGRLKLPLVTVVDTPGADPGHDSEYSGLAGEIARTFEAMLRCPSRTLCLVSGEGGSGGALALAAADVLLMERESVFSVIAPEGAAAILYRDAARSSEVADMLRPTPRDLMSLGIADEVVDGLDPGWLRVGLRGPALTSRRTTRFRGDEQI